jgi:serine/threonine-protein phosphatase 2A regulatory subunit A
MKNLDPIFSVFYMDNAYTVRELGIEKLALMAQEFKADWILGTIIPKLKEVYDMPKQGYLYRMTVISSFVSIIPFLNKEQSTALIAPILIKAMKDIVPNVRFCALKIIKKASKYMDQQQVAKLFKQ